MVISADGGHPCKIPMSISMRCRFGYIGALSTLPVGDTVRHHNSALTLNATTGEYIVRCARTQAIYEGVAEGGAIVFASSRALMKRLGGQHVSALRRSCEWRVPNDTDVTGSCDYSEMPLSVPYDGPNGLPLGLPLGLPDDRVPYLCRM